MTTGARTGNAIHRAMPAFLTYGFRPFFLAAGLWSAVALTMWIVMLDTGVMLPSRFDPLAWHVHEMLFGFVMAAIAGFLLTAIPNWTGRLPVSGGPLALLAALTVTGALPGCAPLIVGGAMVGGTLMAIDRRTSGAQVEDESIELKASSRVSDLATLGHVSITSYNRMVLVTGEVPTDGDKQRDRKSVV